MPHLKHSPYTHIVPSSYNGHIAKSLKCISYVCPGSIWVIENQRRRHCHAVDFDSADSTRAPCCLKTLNYLLGHFMFLGVRQQMSYKGFDLRREIVRHDISRAIRGEIVFLSLNRMC